MVRDDSDLQNTLAPPGAGLPAWQAWFLRYLAFPLVCRTTSWDQAQARFQQEGRRILELIGPLTHDQLQQRVLIKAPIGIEDSSRYWSAAMLLEHLIEVGSRVAVGIVELTNGTPVTVKADIADVKPRGGKTAQIIEDYRQFLDDYDRMVAEDAGDRLSPATHAHPWFGNLSAHQWICLGAVHQSIHRKQLARIVAGLPHVDG